MPHKPGHSKPFTSFLNQGMQNTDNQANNINMPPNPINTPTKPTSFLDNLTMNPKRPGGGGQLFENPGGEVFGSEVDSPPNEFVSNNPLPEGWEWLNIGGNWEAQFDWDLNDDGILNNNDFTLASNQFENPLNWFQELQSFLSNAPEDVNLGTLDNAGMLAFIESIISDWGGNVISNDWQNFLEEEEANVGLKTYDAPEFAGGGGMGGELAKKLYYAPTGGGFTATGTGLGGNQSNFMDLLKKMQGGM
tara:strand:+ start:26 stop:769 length:744 start_codon:yes stop_codon:yes gene_type:complete